MTEPPDGSGVHYPGVIETELVAADDGGPDDVMFTLVGVTDAGADAMRVVTSRATANRMAHDILGWPDRDDD